MSNKTLETHSIPIPPHLAGLLKQALGRTGTGFDEAAFLQQIHYWTSNTQVTGWLVDGVKWIYNSLQSWLGQLPWMSEYGLRKAIANLKKLGLLQTAQHGLSQYNRVMFYHIDYEKLNRFVGNVCEQNASRPGKSDRVDVRSDHSSYTETSSDTPFSEQQTAVVSKEQEQDWDEGDRSLIPLTEQEQKWSKDKGDRSPVLLEEPDDRGEDTAFAPSSGKSAKNKTANFPELIDRVAQALGLTSLPKNLKRAISQYPEQVEGAIAYLQHQQQKRRIENPVGYLYEAIVSGWNLPVAHTPSLLPDGFSQWFEQARRAGLVLAAMSIDGVHHTLHAQKGWMPTAQLMQE